MFGLEKQKGTGKKVEPFIFDIEKDLMKMSNALAMKAKLDGRVQKLKEALRSGGDKAKFDTYGTLLLAYTSLQKVFSRIPVGRG